MRLVVREKLPEQCGRHTELRIGVDARIIIGVDLRNERFESCLEPQRMDMGGPVRVATKQVYLPVTC